MIVVSGCPGSGAADLAARLAARLHFTLWPAPDPAQPVPTFAELLRRVVSASPATVWTGGPADLHAGAAFGFGLPLEPWQRSLLERALQARPTLLLACRFAPSIPAEMLMTRRRLREPKSPLEPTAAERDRGARYVAEYEAYLAGSLLERLPVDAERLRDAHLDRLVEQVAEALAAQRPAYLHALRYRAAGAWPAPELVLVGEGFPEGPMNLAPGALPFIRPTGASATLHRALAALGVRRAYLTNVCKTGDEFRDHLLLAEELQLTRGEAVVALGATAGRALRRIRAVHTEITHPSAQARFHPQSFGAWLKRLARAAERPEWPEAHLAATLSSQLA